MGICVSLKNRLGIDNDFLINDQQIKYIYAVVKKHSNPFLLKSPFGSNPIKNYFCNKKSFPINTKKTSIVNIPSKIIIWLSTRKTKKIWPPSRWGDNDIELWSIEWSHSETISTVKKATVEWIPAGELHRNTQMCSVLSVLFVHHSHCMEWLKCFWLAAWIIHNDFVHIALAWPPSAMKRGCKAPKPPQ